MSFADLMDRMTRAACVGDGAAVAACFTGDGVYNDVFYGTFRGREAIADMIENHFHRDGTAFVWDLHDPVEGAGIGYVRYVFSYESKLPDCAGQRALFEGVSICRLRDGLLTDYREVANAAVGLRQMGFAAERVARILDREGRELAARDEAAHHLRR